jgi:hypothetical protein
MVSDFVSHHRGFFVGLTLRRIFCYWTGFWSLDPAYMRQEPTQLPNVFQCCGLTLLLLFGASAWWRRDRTSALPYILTLVIFPIAYYISHPLMDYRQPIEPEVAILVVLGLRELKWRLKSRSTADLGEYDKPAVLPDHSFDVPSPAYAELQGTEPSVSAG